MLQLEMVCIFWKHLIETYFPPFSGYSKIVYIFTLQCQVLFGSAVLIIYFFSFYQRVTRSNFCCLQPLNIVILSKQKEIKTIFTIWMCLSFKQCQVHVWPWFNSIHCSDFFHHSFRTESAPKWSSWDFCRILRLREPHQIESQN